MIYVLYKNSGVHSGRALRAALQGLKKEGVRGGYPKFFLKKLKGVKPKLIINLGTTELDVPGVPFLNSPDMVRAAANKRGARRTFKEKGVPAPAFFDGGQPIPKEAFPVVGRTSYHSKGKGFWFCADEKAVKQARTAGATHFVKFIPDTREYRVHTFVKNESRAKAQNQREPGDYRSIKISEKVWTGVGTPPKAHQKNHEFGWKFLGQQNRREEELDVVRSAAKEAAAALGVDFGAVDVMYSILYKRAFVLEVNSTPSLADENADTCGKYAERIAQMLVEPGTAKE